jgi:6-phosphogluconate dehydrogenase (decarboxylating)
MEVGVLGLGRMGGNIARPSRAGHDCVVLDLIRPPSRRSSAATVIAARAAPATSSR